MNRGDNDMSIDTKARDNAADTFSRSMRALNSMELADLPPELDQDARDLARIIHEHGKRIIQEHGKDYADTAYDDMTAPLLESLARLVQAAKAAERLAALQSLCAQVYQAAGAFGMPERVLDVLSDAANGDPIRHANILPVDPPAHEARIAKLEQDNARLRDALDHIMRAARRSRTQSRRLRWIEARARCALEGGEDWKELDLPRFSESNQRYLKARIAELEEALAAGGDQ